MRLATLWQCCLLMLTVFTWQDSSLAIAAESAAKLNSELLGRKVDAFTLQDFRGKSHALSDYDDRQTVVLCFLERSVRWPSCMDRVCRA